MQDQMKPIVFVGASSEADPVVTEVLANLQNTATVNPWANIMTLGSSTLVSLLGAAETSDFAVFVFRGDDVTTSRSEAQAAPRDNVVYELGLFTGKLGPERAFLLYDGDDKAKLPSDLKGVTYVPYSGRSLANSVRVACARIQEAMRRLGLRSRTRQFEDRTEAHRYMYHLMADPRVTNVQHASLAISSYAGNAVIDQLNAKLEAFLARDETKYEYLYYDHPDAPHRAERAARLQKSAPRKNSVRVIPVQHAVCERHMPTFLIFSGKGVQEVVVFEQQDVGNDSAWLFGGEGAVHAFQAMFKSLRP